MCNAPRFSCLKSDGPNTLKEMLDIHEADVFAHEVWLIFNVVSQLVFCHVINKLAIMLFV